MFNTKAKLKIEFRIIVIILLRFLIFCFSRVNLLIFYVFFEVVLIPIVLIIFYYGGQYDRIQAGFYILLYTLFGSLPLLLVILFLSNFFSMRYLFLKLNIFNQTVVIVFFLIFAFLIKIPIFGVHL